jgi:hypothetical protein
MNGRKTTQRKERERVGVSGRPRNKKQLMRPKNMKTSKTKEET